MMVAALHHFMFCIATQHDLRLVLLAGLVCVSGAYATFALGAHAATSPEHARLRWAGACVAASGGSIWATHFVAMLAFDPAMPFAFDTLATVGSLITVLLVTALGVAVIGSGGNLVVRALGGGIIGAGVACMHFLGMAAYHVRGHVGWEAAGVAAALLLGIVLAALAGAAALHERRGVRCCGPLLMAGSVCGLHFTAMSAVRLTYDPTLALAGSHVSPRLLAGLVGAVAIGVLLLGLTAAGLDHGLRRRHREERDRMGNLANIAVEGLLICDGEVIVAANDSIQILTGLPSADLIGRQVDTVIEGMLVNSISEGRETNATCLTVSGPVPVRVVRRPIRLGGGSHMVVAVRDQRERLRAEGELRKLALSDPLTGLANRARFQQALQTRMQSDSDSDRHFAIMMLDIDRFKSVNDSLGHPAGDELLRHAARRLASVLRGRDLLTRLGGDEFAILQDEGCRPESVQMVAARIVDVLAQPFEIYGQIVNVGASVGVVIAPSDGDTTDQLMRNVDLALYKAKADGRGRFRMFEPGMDARMQERRALELALRQAIVRQAFELHYQPLLDARSGDVVGAEALIRWRDPVRGLVSPGDFIPLAEETGLIQDIGLWVLRTACAQAASWPEDLTVAVNVSTVQFRDQHLAETVRAVLSQTGLNPSRLELEITESVLVADEGQVRATLEALRATGVRISMDDFGTGYSSLSYLRRFPFDKIKIDRSFVSQAPEDSESAAIVRAIIQLGACLGMRTTVEGVETQDQFDFTSEQGCDQIQGYFVSRPLTSGQFAAFLRQRMPAKSACPAAA